MPHSPELLAPLASPSGPTIALVTDSNDWHTRSLCKAFAAVGARAQRLMLAACRFDTTSPKGLILPGLGAGLPNAVLVRDMAGGGVVGGSAACRGVAEASVVWVPAC